MSDPHSKIDGQANAAGGRYETVWSGMTVVRPSK